MNNSTLCGENKIPLNHKRILVPKSNFYKCCLNKCKRNNNYCTSVCNKGKNTTDLAPNCKNTCQVVQKNCTDYCRGIIPEFNIDNPYYKCATKAGCNLEINQIPNKKCTENNEEQILNCCKSNCVPKSDLNCQNYCETLADTILNPKKINLETRTQELKSTAEVNSRSQQQKAVAESPKIPLVFLGPQRLFPRAQKYQNIFGTAKASSALEITNESYPLLIVLLNITTLCVLFIIFKLIFYRK